MRDYRGDDTSSRSRADVEWWRKAAQCAKLANSLNYSNIFAENVAVFSCARAGGT
jgi:hypothetical protein